MQTAGRLIPIVSNYPNGIVTLHLFGPYPVSRFVYAICTAVNETTGKPPAELFLGPKFVTPFQKLVLVSHGTEFSVGDIERLFEEARRNTKDKHEKWEKHHNRRRHDVQIKVTIYRHRKCDETEIRTSSSDNGSLRDESSGFDRVQRRSNESRDGKKKSSDVKRESIPSSWSEKSRIKRSENEIIGYKRSRESGSSGPDRKVRKSSKYRVPKRDLSSNDSNVLQKCSRKRPKQDKVAVNTNWYNLRPRGGREVESRPAMEMKTQH
ncbi:uncharacterized protein TNCV_1561851 [Trichonephila clavipes]|nr:uncharacterized protein TNCV_1561851 [Trichonephila clavipes]